MRRVVITGLGCVSPIGNNVNETWDAIKNNKCGIDEITYFDTTDMKVKLAGEVKNLNPEEKLDAKFVKNNDKFTVYAKLAASEAMADSKLTDYNKERMGVIIASGIGGLETIDTNANVLRDRGASRISPFFIPKALINLAAGQVAIDYGCMGYVSSVVTACAAGTNALGDAYLRIKNGYEDIMLAGGAEAAITKLGIAGFQSMKALCTSTDKNRASIPFDNDRSGFVMGEGAAVLVLEEYEHAKARGAHIYAEFVGYGASCDAHHITAPLADGSGAALAMKQALAQANIKANQIDYINAHGTSTHLNDAGETMAIKKVFGEDTKVMVSSTKSNTGHLLGASGALEGLIIAKAIEEGLVPATINYQNPDPECDLDIVPNKNRCYNLEYAMSNSLGFGGHNASIIFKKIGE